jgi:cell wall-associated NlpC family hydrolase
MRESGALSRLNRSTFPPLPTLASLILAFFTMLSFGTAGVVYAVDSAASAAPTAGTQFRVAGTDGAALRLREKPGLTAPIMARLPEGTIVTLAAGAATEADGERWLQVQTAQKEAGQNRGWAAARYLARVVPQSETERQPSPDASFGQRAAATAERYIGQPFAWGGNAPGGFDCSGFVQWVYTQAGLRMPRLMSDQMALGTKVDQSALQVGDLVAFKDTYKPGLSHNGIYLGSNRFVHAVDEARGVSVSNLQDDYWKPRYFQAVRLRP